MIVALVLGGATAVALTSGGGGEDVAQGGEGSGEVETGSAEDPSGGGSGSVDAAAGGQDLDIDGVDPCSLLDEGDLGALITVSGVASQNMGEACFWASTAPGEPGYVELTFRAQDTVLGLPNGCAAEPIEGVGETLGAVCTISSQTKVIASSQTRGVAVQMSVNEPGPPITPVDVALVIEQVFDQLEA